MVRRTTGAENANCTEDARPLPRYTRRMRIGSLAVYLLAALVFCACSVDRAGLNGPDSTRDDGGRIDLATRDSGTMDLAMRDSSIADQDLGPAPRDLGPTPPDLGPTPPDLGRPDLGPPDLGRPDLGPPDLGRPDLGFELPTCDLRFSSADSYSLCEQRPTECEFYTQLDSSTCAARCALFGATCIAGYADGTTECERLGVLTCDSMQFDGICVCSR